MVHGTIRIGLVYTSGVLMGSLFSSIIDASRLSYSDDSWDGTLGSNTVIPSDFHRLILIKGTRWCFRWWLLLDFCHVCEHDFKLWPYEMVLASYQESFSSWKNQDEEFCTLQNSQNDQRFLPIAAFVTNDVIVTLDMISNDVKIRTSWAAHLGGAFAGWVKHTA